MYRNKVVRGETKVLDLKVGRIHAVVSSEGVDRDGDIIRQSGWGDLTDFMRHPVLLSSHDYRSLRSQIGEWEEMAVKGKRLEGVARYYVGEGNAEADWGFNLASKGRAAFSVGFLPDMKEAKVLPGGNDLSGPFEFTRQELLEVSHVVIPANPAALQSLKGFAPLQLDPTIAEVVEEMLLEAGVGPWDMTEKQKDLIERIAERIVEKLRSPAIPAGHSLAEVIARW